MQELIADIRTKYSSSDEKARYIRQDTDDRVVDTAIASTVLVHRNGRIFLDGVYRGQVNGKIRTSHNRVARCEDLSDPKCTDAGEVFDIIAMTVIHTHLPSVAP